VAPGAPCGGAGALSPARIPPALFPRAGRFVSTHIHISPSPPPPTVNIPPPPHSAPPQVTKLLGHAAPEDFRRRLEDAAVAHHPQLVLDTVTAYAFGNRYFAELEILLPAEMTVRESHDIALELQQQVRWGWGGCGWGRVG
jgi:hypothetical protein